jgi:D-serine dehydratase
MAPRQMNASPLPFPPRNGAEIAETALNAIVKGVPARASPLRLEQIKEQGWNLLSGDLPLPAAVLRYDRMRANSDWMTRFLSANGLQIAPHGKTSMAPQLYAMQHEAGAWAITVATTQQLAVVRHFGFPRAILANQPIGRVAIDACLATLTADDDFDLLVLADSVAVVRALSEGAARAVDLKRSLGVLVEVGVAGGRTGARSNGEALEIARLVAQTPGLELRGIECYEGLLSDTAAVDALLDAMLSVADAACAENIFKLGVPVILSAGGSAFYDRVGERLEHVKLGDRPILKLVRSGCYLTHDSEGYKHHHERILRETRLRLPPGQLQAALEVWAYVQSRPEPGKAILTVGKRDISYDLTLPHPLLWFRPGVDRAPTTIPAGHQVQALNDQHCHMLLPEDSPLAVGDMVAFGVNHPCTTFDKWDLLLVVNEKYGVIDAVKTYF